MPTPPDEDWYCFSLDDGQLATLALTGAAPGDLTLELYGNGELVAAGVATDNVDQVINNFRDPTSDGSPDMYYVRVNGTGGDYSLLVTRGGDFDIDNAKDILRRRGRGLTLDDYEETTREMLMQACLLGTIAAAAKVTDDEARHMYRYEETKVTLSLTRFEAKAFETASQLEMEPCQFGAIACEQFS